MNLPYSLERSIIMHKELFPSKMTFVFRMTYEAIYFRMERHVNFKVSFILCLYVHLFEHMLTTSGFHLGIWNVYDLN